MNNRIVAIACGMKEPKKNYSIISKRNLYLNYGLLGLCTILKSKGYNIMQFQGEYQEPKELIHVINDTEFDLRKIKMPILISIVSFLSIEWCYEFTKILKTEYGLTCILGGKYVVDGNVDWLKKKLPYIDLFVEGAGEDKIEDALNHLNYDAVAESNNYYTQLDYSLLYNYKEYNPSIELARGCGRGCAYCADGNRKRTALKPPENIIEELYLFEKIYDYEHINLYYQMATFQVNYEWIKKYKKYIGDLKKIINWRCTSRIDVIATEMLPQLAEIGLKVIDLGLESASPKQLQLMRKTNEPEKYLRKAEEILRIAYECGIWVKLNILLMAGETVKTIEETQQWLNRNKKYIKGISSNCETIYGPHNKFIDDLKPLGASLVKDDALMRKGYSYINLSEEIDYSLAREYARNLSKSVMSEEDYFDLKKYGYFSRYYEKEQFYSDLQRVNKNKLPFEIKRR